MQRKEPELLGDAEEVVRAIRSSDWDEAKNRYSSNLFVGPNTSVSRLSVLGLDEIFSIFFSDLHKPPVHEVQRAGQISVRRIKELAQQLENNGRPDPREISVVADPLEENRAHALIREKLPRKLAFAIINDLIYHEAPPVNKAKRWWHKVYSISFWARIFQKVFRIQK